MSRDIGGKVSKVERNWQFVEQYPNEPDSLVRARRLSTEHGVEPVSPSVASELSLLAAVSNARTICEIGTGLGVSGLALLRHAPNATLTTIERESEYVREARPIFTEAGIPSSRVRFVEGDALHIMPRLNLSSYDIVLLDAEPEILLELFEYALGIVRQGGTIIIPNALAHGQVADPAVRDSQTQSLRDLLAVVAESPATAASLSASGGGLLTVVKLAA
nr:MULTISPECIES: O-methyltransferase [unclassified Leucobacter]